MNCNSFKLDPFFCSYAADMLLPLLHLLEKEMENALSHKDDEPIHKSLVISRRIREALPIFSPCFTDPILRKWDKQLKRLSSSFGNARDLDVQIAFISSYLSWFDGKNVTSGHFFSFLSKPYMADDPSELSLQITDGPVNIECFVNDRIGVECLLLRLIQKRIRTQKKVMQAVHGIQRKQIIPDIKEYLKKNKKHAEQRGIELCSAFSFEQAYVHIISRIHDLMQYESSLSNPQDIRKHHKMRIAAKNLRYAMESFSHLFEGRLADEINVIKKIQEFLGDIHDCDVWIAYLPVFLDQERKRAIKYTGNERIFHLIVPGIVTLSEDRKRVRNELFHEIGIFWSQLKENLFFENLATKISVTVSFPGVDFQQLCYDPPLVACISDIHGNLPALEAVITDARSRGASIILNAGDSLGYGGFPDEVIRCLRDNKIISIAGNFDSEVIKKTG